MPRCTCAGNACNCLVQAGDNVVVSGRGTVQDPYIVSSTGGGGGGTAAWGAIGGNLADQTDLQTELNLKVPKSLVDAKGDLIVATGNDTPARLPVGSNGQVLTADSAQSTGMKWATPSGSGGGGGPTLIPKPGSFITSVFTDANGGAGPLGLATGAVGGARFFFGAGFDVAALMIRLQTGEASTSVKILLYDSDANGYPKNLVVNSGPVDVSSGTYKTATFTPVSIDAGTYWGFVRSNSPGGTLRIWGVKQQGVPQVYPSTNQGPSTSGGTIKADVGTYASPTATLTSWDESAPGNYDTVPYILVGRAS